MAAPLSRPSRECVVPLKSERVSQGDIGRSLPWAAAAEMKSDRRNSSKLPPIRMMNGRLRRDLPKNES
jgi:hypothetical protein